MKPIRVASEEEFERLLDHMASEAHRASDHWHLLKGLEAARKTYGVEMHQSVAFWSFTLLAHYDVTLFRLARLYDQHDCSLSLKRFLLTVKARVDYFSEKARRDKLKHNSFAEGLLSRKLNLPTLRTDIRRVSQDSDPLVNRLVEFRNGSLSHVEPNPVRLGTVSSLRRLTDREIRTLLNRARTILNRYSLIYRATMLSTQVVGSEDYKHVLDLVRRGRNSMLAEREAERRRFTSSK